MTQQEWIVLREDLEKNAEKAFESLYNHLWHRLFSVSLNYVRNKAVAQEIVQDVFVNLWVARKRLADVTDIRSFAMRAIQNRIYDHFDKKSVQDRYILKISQSQTKPVNSTQHQVEYEETFQIIHSEIDKLPATTQKVFRLSRFERFSNEEIAERLQLSVKAVEYHITQALKQLRMRLKFIEMLLLIALGPF